MSAPKDGATRQSMNMIKKIFFFLIILFAAGLIFYVYSPQKKIDIVEIKQETEKEPIPDPIVLQVGEMSLSEKIGQLLIVGFVGKNLDPHMENMIEKYHIGGINLLGRNVKDASQIKKLISDLQDISDIDLFIGTDQEGGRVVRFKFLNELQSQLQIKSSAEAEKVAFNRAVELHRLGVNMNFSPVVDYVSDSNSYLFKRTFGATPEDIGEFANAMINGYQKAGVIAVAKHFPGYGNVILDPHKMVHCFLFLEKSWRRI